MVDPLSSIAQSHALSDVVAGVHRALLVLFDELSQGDSLTRSAVSAQPSAGSTSAHTVLAGGKRLV